MPHIEIRLEDLPLGVPVRIEHGREGVVVIRTAESVNAFEDSCPHAQWRLSDGHVNGSVLECPGHGWEFNVSTGRCLNVPAYGLRSYRVIVSNQVVRIDWEECTSRAENGTECGKVAHFSL